MTASYEQGKTEALAWFALNIEAKSRNAGPPPVPHHGVPMGDDYDKGWNEIAAKASNPIAQAFLYRQVTDPDRWSRYVELCGKAGVDPWPESVDPKRVMRDGAYMTRSALAASVRLECTRQVWPDPERNN